MTILRLLLIFPIALLVFYLIEEGHLLNILSLVQFLSPLMIAIPVYFLVIRPIVQRRRYKSSAKTLKAKNEASLAAMVAEQEALESAERQRKSINPVVPLTTYFTNPGKFTPVVKYMLKFVDLGGVYYEKNSIEHLVFFADNRFKVEGEVVEVAYSTRWLTHFDRTGQGRYDVTSADGFQVLVNIRIGEQTRRVYINILYTFKPSTQNSPQGGYKLAKESSPWDVFGGRLVTGARICVTGELFKRVRDQYIKTEIADNRWIQPAGFYLVCSAHDLELG